MHFIPRHSIPRHVKGPLIPWALSNLWTVVTSPTCLNATCAPIKPAISPLLSSRAVADDILDVTASTEALGKTAGKDLNMDKTTYPKLLGLDGSRKEARRLVDEAKSALSIFGDRATPLLAIADYIVDREN